MELFHGDFEKPFLEASRQYYCKERDWQLNLQNIPSYLDHVVKRQREELSDRAEAYLSLFPGTVQALDGILNEVFIVSVARRIVFMPTTGLGYILAEILAEDEPGNHQHHRKTLETMVNLFKNAEINNHDDNDNDNGDSKESIMRVLEEGLSKFILDCGKDMMISNGSGNSIVNRFIHTRSFIEGLSSLYAGLVQGNIVGAVTGNKNSNNNGNNNDNNNNNTILAGLSFEAAMEKAFQQVLTSNEESANALAMHFDKTLRTWKVSKARQAKPSPNLSIICNYFLYSRVMMVVFRGV